MNNTRILQPVGGIVNAPLSTTVDAIIHASYKIEIKSYCIIE